MNKLRFEEKYITPKMAEALLRKNETNRTLSLKTVEAYAEDMRQGHWDYRSDCGISIDSEGILRDGQHRLNAIIKYGKPVKFVIRYNASSTGIYDAGRKRSDRDQLNMSRSDLPAVMRQTRFISLVRMLISGDSGAKVTASQISDYIDNNFDKLAEFAPITNTTVSKITTVTVYYSLYLAYLNGVAMTDIKHFMEILRSGMSETPRDYPIIAYRNYLLSLGGTVHATRDEVCKCQGALKKYISRSNSRRLYMPKDLIWNREVA